MSSATNHAVDDRLAVCEWPSTVYDWLRRRKYIDDDVDDDDNDDDADEEDDHDGDDDGDDDDNDDDDDGTRHLLAALRHPFSKAPISTAKRTSSCRKSRAT